MSECTHELWEREVVVADGDCPLCLSAILHSLSKERDEARAQVVQMTGVLSENIELSKDAERWKAVRDNRSLQGSLNGYSTFTQTVDAALAAKER